MILRFSNLILHMNSVNALSKLPFNVRLLLKSHDKVKKVKYFHYNRIGFIFEASVGKNKEGGKYRCRQLNQLRNSAKNARWCIQSGSNRVDKQTQPKMIGLRKIPAI